VIEALEPLAAVPGVRFCILVSPDGVPVVMRGKSADAGDEHANFLEQHADSLSGLAAGWLQGLKASIAPLGWTAPNRVVLRAARGTLVMTHAPSSVLLVILDPGCSAEELRLPMEGAVARMQRMLRSRSDARRATSNPAYAQGSVPPAPGSQVVEGPGMTPADSNWPPTPPPFPG
jgi:predicted regulator of Ras-like GTPase activity (Roadblock/LC7/MglB family)